MHRVYGVLAGLLLAALGCGLGLALPAPAHAQSRSEAEKKLATVKRELETVATERRRLESQRGEAARKLRQADEQVGVSARRLHEVERQLAQDEAQLSRMQQRRVALEASLGGRRAELQRLVCAAYMQPAAAPLKMLLAQDSVADGQRVLTYHRYLQRQRANRIGTLTAQLAELQALEARIATQRVELAGLRMQQREQLDQLERNRRNRAVLLAQLDARYHDRRTREQALGRDALALEQLLRELRTAAARAQAERQAAAAKAARDARATGKRPSPPKRSAVAPAPALPVGGLGWPVSGRLLAGFGATTPGGGRSNGLLIGAATGTPAKAVAEGAVVYAEWMTGYGLLLIIDHGNGYMSLYAHNAALLKRVGDRVRQGDAVATVGDSGGYGRPALYFELRRHGAPVNPGTWLRR